jgi:hypothetical protein
MKILYYALATLCKMIYGFRVIIKLPADFWRNHENDTFETPGISG